MGLMKARSSDSQAKHDERIADETITGLDLMCKAHGCPNRWTVLREGQRLCSWHAWREMREWPLITRTLLDAEAARAQLASEMDLAEQTSQRLDRDALVARLRALKETFTGPRDRRAFAEALRQREANGERLTVAQRAIWRAACRHESGPYDIEDAR